MGPSAPYEKTMRREEATRLELNLVQYYPNRGVEGPQAQLTSPNLQEQLRAKTSRVIKERDRKTSALRSRQRRQNSQRTTRTVQQLPNRMEWNCHESPTQMDYFYARDKR